MVPMKSQGSSRRKGEEAIFDPSTALDVGEEVEYSKSKHSDEEEAYGNHNNECAPLIDLWYDIHPHFPKILVDYASLSLGCVWLALSQQNPIVS